jgi:hypothetical protein
MPAATIESPPSEPTYIGEWGDWRWRLSNIYFIQDERGHVVQFRPNPSQIELLEEWWYLNLILKARQLGFTTLIDLLALDQCVFVPSYAAGIIAHNLDDAEKIFRRKVKFPYTHLPEAVKMAVPLRRETTSQLTFENDSEISVGVSMRSGTMQFLHVSEFGKICAKYPAKAEEIVTGSFNAVHAGQIIVVESTAEGRYGDFYEMCQRARALQDLDDPLTKLDFKFHFFPWWADPRNVLQEKVAITKDLRQYFRRLAREFGILTNRNQQNWYAKKLEQHNDNWDLMKRENPSHPDEAFEAAIEGSYYGALISKMRLQGRIRNVPLISSEVVNTFWDLGRNDINAIWFHQFVAGEHRFIDYYENRGEDLGHYYDHLRNLREDEGYRFGRHYLPHDADNKNLERNESRVDRLVELGMDDSAIVVVERIEDLQVGIELTRKVLPNCWFDKERCDVGLKRLEEYRKTWDEKLATFHDHPAKTDARNGADAFRQFAQGWNPAPSGKRGKAWDRSRARTSFRTA